MPGMMDTVLNLGLNETTTRRAWQAGGRPRALPMTAIAASSRCIPNVVLGLRHDVFEEILEDYKEREDYQLDTDMTAEDWKAIIGQYKQACRTSSASPSPMIPMTSSGAPSARCSARG